MSCFLALLACLINPPTPAQRALDAVASGLAAQPYLAPTAVCQQAARRFLLGRVFSVHDSTSLLPGVELVFRPLGREALAASWRVITQADGRFRLALPVGYRYGVEVRCQARQVAVVEWELRAAPGDTSVVQHNFYVPCREPAAIEEPAPRLYFAAGQAALSSKAVQTLGAVRRNLAANPSLAVRLEGHAARQEARPGQPAPQAYLLRLGQRRAQAAYTYLRQAGIPATQLSTHSFGSQRPLVPNNVAEALSFNPHVEFRVVTAVSKKGNASAQGPRPTPAPASPVRAKAPPQPLP